MFYPVRELRFVPYASPLYRVAPARHWTAIAVHLRLRLQWLPGAQARSRHSIAAHGSGRGDPTMTDSVADFRRELTAIAEREWARLSDAQRLEILLDYDAKAHNEDMEFAIFIEQWKRERDG